MEGKFVAYHRVSTARQGRSGLGLEAQRHAVEEYLNGGRWKLLKEFTEIESGKRNDRPQLEKALSLCRQTGSTLVISKLDRLSRDAAFLLSLRDAKVEFVAADMPQANRLTVGIMALVAEQEREAISRRTKDALAAAKRRGVKLGNPNGAKAFRRAGKGNAAAVEAVKAMADEHAMSLLPILQDAISAGARSLRAIAATLDEQGMQTPRGGRWHKSAVRNLLNRCGIDPSEK